MTEKIAQEFAEKRDFFNIVEMYYTKLRWTRNSTLNFYSFNVFRRA